MSSSVSALVRDFDATLWVSRPFETDTGEGTASWFGQASRSGVTFCGHSWASGVAGSYSWPHGLWTFSGPIITPTRAIGSSTGVFCPIAATFTAPALIFRFADLFS